MTKEHDPLMESARIALLNKEIAEARLLLDQVVKQSPENYHALLWLAGIAETPAASLLLVEKAKAIAPTSSTVAKAMVWAQKRQRGAVATPPPGVVAPPIAASGALAASGAKWGAWHWFGGAAALLLFCLVGWGLLSGKGVSADLSAAFGKDESIAFLPTDTPSADGATPTISQFHLKSTKASQTIQVLELTQSAESAATMFQLTETASSNGTSLLPSPTATERPTQVPTQTPRPTEMPQPTTTAMPIKSGLRPKLVTDSAQIFPTWTPTPQPTAVPTAVYEAEVAPTSSGNNSQFPYEYRWIDVDLTNQSLVAYENGVPVYSTLVSSGLWDTPTVTGQYRVYLRLESQDMNGYNIGYDYFIPDVPYVMYFTGNYALHGAYWHNDFGRPRSHGCVNLSVQDAEWLFKFSKIGTLVNVHY